MSRAQEFTIEGVLFRVHPFDAFTQLQMFGDLQREILPSLGGVLNVALAKGEKGAEDDAAVISAFRDLCTRLDGTTLTKWAKKLINGEYITFELDGRDPVKLSPANMGDALPDFSMVLELMFCVGKVNFASPLQRWASLTGLAQKLTARLSASSPTPSSTSS